MAAPCLHGGGVLTSSQTTGSWVADLRDGDRHWVTGTAAPCTSLFKPVTVDVPRDLGPFPGDTDDASLWWRHEHLHRRAMANPEVLFPRFTPERDRTELAWLRSPPDSAEAFYNLGGALKQRDDFAGAETAGLQVHQAFLDNNDSHAFFRALGDLINTGATGTNVGDLQILLLA